MMGGVRVRAGWLCLMLALAGCAAPSGRPTELQREFLKLAREALDRGDTATAFARYARLAEAGVAQAQYQLGRMYERGQGTAANPAQALYWYGLAAQAGDARAMRALADLQWRAAQGPADRLRALTWYTRAAQAGDTKAAARAGQIFLKGAEGIPPQPERARPYLVEAAEAGDPGAALALARLLAERGGAAGAAEAQRWYARAAELLARRVEDGDVKAMERLALLHLEGLGTPPDPRRGLRLLERAAAAGSERAAVRLARIYRDGRYGIAPDIDRAILLYARASARGDPTAAYELGRLYLQRGGGVRDLRLALRQLTRAAEAGEERAWFWIGEIRRDPDSPLFDRDKAVEAFRNSARSGEVKALDRLGRLAEQAGDRTQALAWYALAAERGYRPAQGRAERLGRRLAEADRQQAFERLDQLRRRFPAR